MMPVVSVGAPPATYQEWLEHLDYIRNHPRDRARLRLLRKGTLIGGAQVMDLFLRRLDDAVGGALSRRISMFLEQVDRAFGEGDFEEVELLSIRFCSDASECFFFEALTCIPQPQREQFVRGFSEQLERFWSEFLRHLHREAEEASGGAELEELVYRLRRLDRAWQGKGRCGNGKLSADQG